MPRPASSFSTSNSGIIAPPSTFEVNGVQYVAVQSGYGVNAAFRQELMNQLVGWQKDVPQRRRRLGLRRLQVSPSLFATGRQQWRPVPRPAGFRCLVGNRTREDSNDATSSTGSTLIRFSAFALVAVLATSPASLGFEQARADESPAYVVEVTDLSAKVGEPALLHATLHTRHVAHSRRLPRSRGLQQSRDRALVVG